MERKELTQREREVLVAIADGLSNKEISTRLGIEVRTVETQMASAPSKALASLGQPLEYTILVKPGSWLRHF